MQRGYKYTIAKILLILIYVAAIVILSKSGCKLVYTPEQYELWGNRQCIRGEVKNGSAEEKSVSAEEKNTSAEEKSVSVEEKNISGEENETPHHTSLLNISLSPTIGNNGYLINCTNIAEIKIGKTLGKGSRKIAYLGIFRGRTVAVKTLSLQSLNLRECKEVETDRFVNCRNFPNMMALNEIVLHTQLKHPGFIQLLGYCVKDVLNPPLPGVPANKQHIVSVFEYGEKYKSSRKYSLRERLQFALDLCDVLDYLEHSPLGSLHMMDFNAANTVLHQGHLKLSDIERLSATEPQCSDSCSFGLSCNKGRCTGHNAKDMMRMLRSRFFPKLLSGGGLPVNISEELEQLRTDKHLTAAQAKVTIKSIMQKI